MTIGADTAQVLPGTGRAGRRLGKRYPSEVPDGPVGTGVPVAGLLAGFRGECRTLREMRRVLAGAGRQFAGTIRSQRPGQDSGESDAAPQVAMVVRREAGDAASNPVRV